MDTDKKLLSDITVFSKYSRHLPDELRRETWDEVIDRNKGMHKEKFPQIADIIEEVYERSVYNKKVLPSMRSLQFAGVPILRNNARIYNCAYLPVEKVSAFSETMFLLLGGSGVGYSVQRRHIKKLPRVIGTTDRTVDISVDDTIEGWADAVKALTEAYFHFKDRPVFNFNQIRPKGAVLKTSGGRAPGHKPLKECLILIERLLKQAVGRKLNPIEAHDIQCYIADAVLAGGIRRAAMISLFSLDDEEMINAKSGEWWKHNPQRARANNSVALLRGHVDKATFDELWIKIRNSGAGEPGVYWTNNLDWGTNPCCEIALEPYQFCNLTEINTSNITSQSDFNDRARCAATIGTLQAAYTDFTYLNPLWKSTTERSALIGVGLTGIASNAIEDLDEAEAAEVVRFTNYLIAAAIGIKSAARLTTVKPAGTTSLVVGSSSGIHAWHNDYYVRRMRFNKQEPAYLYLKSKLPELFEEEKIMSEEDTRTPDQLADILTFPQSAPVGATVRTEDVMDFLERVSRYNKNWVMEGHNSGDNHNNVSTTVSIKEDEWEKVGEWMWRNKDSYNGISVLPYDGGTYVQAPFEDVDKETFDKLLAYILEVEEREGLDLTDVRENVDGTARAAEPACAGGVCEITTL